MNTNSQADRPLGRGELVGVGVDVVSIERFAETLRRTPGIAERILAPGELAEETGAVAGAFAAKEAVMKSLGSGLTDMAMSEIVAASGIGVRAVVELSGRAQDRATMRGVAIVEVEVSAETGPGGRRYLVAEAYAFGPPKL